MNRDELFNEFKLWLEAQNIISLPDPEDHDFMVRMNLDNGAVQLRILCEDSPAALQLVGFFPVKVPKERAEETGRVLHKLNSHLRIGAFNLISKDRLVTYRLTIPIHREVDLADQFGRSLTTLLNTVDDYLPLLVYCLSNTKENRQKLARMVSADALTEEDAEKTQPRFELN